MISATILTKNSERHITDVLEALRDFEEVIVLDTGSTDKTITIANNFKNVKIFFSGFMGFGTLHNKASELAKNDWILSLDSDEVISRELLNELFSIELREDCVYSFNFRNYFNEKFIKCCGWYPERHVRLYNKKAAKFSNSLVHEHIEGKGLKEIKLKGYINHYSFDSIDDFLVKMQNYSTLFARNYVHKKRSSIFKAIIHSMFTFCKCYVLRRGFLYGYEGFLISICNANGTLYKYLKLYEANKRNKK